MTRLVQFYGQELYEPDTYSKTNVDGLNLPSVAGVGRLALIGEAEGGEPKTIIKLTNRDIIKQLFRKGALADMGQLAFRAGVDEDVLGGASEVYFYNTSTRTRSILDIGTFDAKSKDYGPHTNKLNIEIVADALDTEQSLAKLITVEFEGEEVESPSLGLKEFIRLEYVGAGATCTAQIDAARTKLSVDVAGVIVDFLFSSYPTVGDLIAALEAQYTVDLVVTQPNVKSSFSNAEFDHQVTALDIKTAPLGLRASAYEFSEWINANTLIDVTRKTAAAGATIAPVIVKTFFAGATKTTTTTSDFQDGFNAFRHKPINTIIPLVSSDGAVGSVDFDSVRAQAKDFAASVGSIIGRNETQVYLGDKITKSQFKDFAPKVNHRAVQCCPQYIRDINIDGELVDHPSYAMAVVMAQTQMGSAIGTSLTGKTLPVDSVLQDSSWNPTDDMKELLLSGYLIARHDIETNIPYIVKGITSVVDSDNNGNTQIEVVESLQQYAFQLRRFLTTAIRGKNKGNPTRPDLGGLTPRDIKSLIEVFSEFAIDNRIITGFSQESVSVRFAGDVIYPKVSVEPREGINFVLLEIDAVRLF